MSANLTLIAVAMALIGCGVYLLLARSVVRALLGFLLMSNGVNALFIVASGLPQGPPVVDPEALGPVSDPVPQALVLTAIVITLAMTAFVLALAHRAWQIGRSDLLSDDVESSRIHRKAERDDPGQHALSQEEEAALSADTSDSDEDDSDDDHEGTRAEVAR